MTGPTGAKRSPVENRSRRLRCLQDLDDPIDDRRDDKSRPPLRRRKIREGERYATTTSPFQIFPRLFLLGSEPIFPEHGFVCEGGVGTALRRRALRNRMKSRTSPYVGVMAGPLVLMVYWWFRVRRTVDLADGSPIPPDPICHHPRDEEERDRGDVYLLRGRCTSGGLADGAVTLQVRAAAAGFRFGSSPTRGSAVVLHFCYLPAPGFSPAHTESSRPDV